MSRVVKQCVDEFLKDHQIHLYQWQYEAMVAILSGRGILQFFPHHAGKTFLFETLEQFLKERSNHVASEITYEKKFNQFCTDSDHRRMRGDHGVSISD